jgi:hypothetical protein
LGLKWSCGSFHLARRVNAVLWEGEHMTTVAFITAVCCRVDEPMKAVPNHPQATLWPSEVVTLGLRHALQGVGHRAF